MKARMIFALICLLGLTACHGKVYRLPQPGYSTSQYATLGEASETATGIQLFGFIPIQQTDKIQRAVEAVIASKDGDAITNVEVRERWYWAYVLNIYKVDVTGTVLKKR